MRLEMGGAHAVLALLSPGPGAALLWDARDGDAVEFATPQAGASATRVSRSVLEHAARSRARGRRASGGDSIRGPDGARYTRQDPPASRESRRDRMRCDPRRRHERARWTQSSVRQRLAHAASDVHGLLDADAGRQPPRDGAAGRSDCWTV